MSMTKLELYDVVFKPNERSFFGREVLSIRVTVPHYSDISDTVRRAYLAAELEVIDSPVTYMENKIEDVRKYVLESLTRSGHVYI